VLPNLIYTRRSRRSNARILFPARHALHKVHANENESFFGNCVDRNFAGIPPIPQKNAEWMGHGSLCKYPPAEPEAL
jgi:hypothetical protein